jgi:alpha-amylase/alpha-mannosidase (GH57 family)
MIYWAMLLHFYQPPTQVHSMLDKVSDEAYRPLIAVLKANPNARLSVNINGCLTEMLAEHGKLDILQGLDELVQQKQIEFTGSGKYHPILPLIPQTEITRQINENRRTNRKFISYQPRGFFPPEMCIGTNIIDPVLSTGHDWIIASGIACPLEWPIDTIHYVNSPAGKLSVFFRDDVLSNRISFHEIDVPGFIKHLLVFGRDKKDDIYIVTAMDAETFGHHIKNWENDFLDALYKELAGDPDPKTSRSAEKKPEKLISTELAGNIIKPVTISELLHYFKVGKAIKPKPSSWSTGVEDLRKGNPYPLWNSPDNQIHQLLWEHLNLSIEMVNKAVRAVENNSEQHPPNFFMELLDPALHSDQFWWASKKPYWEVNLINRGLALQQECLLNAYRAIHNSMDINDKEKQEYRYKYYAAENIANNIKRHLFDSNQSINNC